MVRQQFSPICVSTFTNVLALHFKIKIWPTICAASPTVTIDFKIADTTARESSDAYLLRLEKNLSKGFEVIDIFCKNTVLNICPYLKGFYTFKKVL